MATVSVSSAFSQGWELIKKNPGITIGSVFVATFVPYLITNFLPIILGWSLAYGLVGNITSVLFSMGVVMIFLKLIRSQTANWSELYTNYPKFFHVFAAGLLFFAAVFAGLILLIIPGIYVALRLQFFMELILDKNKGIIESLKGSWELTKGHELDLFMQAALSIVAVIAGALAIVVGLIVALPLTYAARFVMYQSLIDGDVAPVKEIKE